jgi:hypothetical protein
VLLLVLQLVQQAVDSFDPRLVVTLLLAAGIGLTGLAIEMSRTGDRKWREPWAVVPAAGAGAAFLSVVVLGLTIGIRTPEPPEPVPLGEQVENARAAGARGDRQSIGSERVDFRGSGQRSYFLEFGDEPGVPRGRARSDEIQVWDVRGGELRRALAFEPGLLGQERTLFQFRDVGDIDGDGAEELVGGFGTEAIRGEVLVPFAVDWDSDARRYRLIVLTPQPPEFATKARGPDERGLRSTYLKRLALTNRHPGSFGFAGYPAQDFTVSRGHQILVKAYVSDIRPDRRVLELQPQLFRRTGGSPGVTPCALEGRPTLTAELPLARSQRLEGALQEFWREASEGRNCELSS